MGGGKMRRLRAMFARMRREGVLTSRPTARRASQRGSSLPRRLPAPSPRQQLMLANAKRRRDARRRFKSALTKTRALLSVRK